jgi:hypothetical protein
LSMTPCWVPPHMPRPWQDCIRCEEALTATHTAQEVHVVQLRDKERPRSYRCSVLDSDLDFEVWRRTWMSRP